MEEVEISQSITLADFDSTKETSGGLFSRWIPLKKKMAAGTSTKLHVDLGGEILFVMGQLMSARNGQPDTYGGNVHGYISLEKDRKTIFVECTHHAGMPSKEVGLMLLVRVLP